MTTPFQFVLRLDLATRWCFGWALQRQKSRHLERVSRVLSTQKIERLDLARFSRTPIYTARRVRVRGNKSVIESILSSSSSYGNASVRSSHTGVFAPSRFLSSCPPSCPPPSRCHPRRRPRFNLDTIAGPTTISIPMVTKPAIYSGDLLPYL